MSSKQTITVGRALPQEVDFLQQTEQKLNPPYCSNRLTQCRQAGKLYLLKGGEVKILILLFSGVGKIHKHSGEEDQTGIEKSSQNPVEISNWFRWGATCKAWTPVCSLLNFKISVKEGKLNARFRQYPFMSLCKHKALVKIVSGEKVAHKLNMRSIDSWGTFRFSSTAAFHKISE